MGRKSQILIVDDDAGLTSNLQYILEEEGYNTAVAYDGQTALALCEENAFDLAFIDIKLPDMSGVELIDKLAQLYLETLYILITGHASPETAMETVKLRNVL